MKTYGEKGSGLSMVGSECTCLFYWSSSLNKVTKKYIKPSLDFSISKNARTTKTSKQWMKLRLDIMRFNHGGCHLVLQQKEAFLVSPSGWGFGTSVIRNGVVICLS